MSGVCHPCAEGPVGDAPARAGENAPRARRVVLPVAT